MCYLNKIRRRPAKLGVIDFELRKSLCVSENFFLKIIRIVEYKLEFFRKQQITVVKKMTGKTVGEFLRKMACGIRFLCVLKIKILENLSTAVIVKILRKQSHKQIHCCKNYSRTTLVCFDSQHSAKVINIYKLKN